MKQLTPGRLARQVRLGRQRLCTDQDLCLQRLLPTAQVTAAIARHGVRFRRRLYTPLVTLWVFLYQVLSPDPSCRAAVARLLARLGVDSPRRVSAKTDPYCKARQRLPEALLTDLAWTHGRQLHRRVGPTGLLQGRPIKIADGTTLSMPDTQVNQKAYPQPPTQKPGLGFPMLRMVGLISLSCGAVLAAAVGPYTGKQTGEAALLRPLLASLEPGDVLLLDAYYAHYWVLALLWARGVDVVVHHDGKRPTDFRRGQRLGNRDQVIVWTKPSQPPPWMSWRQYRRMPDHLMVRQLQVPVTPRGFRVKRLVLDTTLTEATAYPREDLARAYRCRWQAELDLRSIKQALRMDVLRCQSPSMVRKEVWMHLLAYNLIRHLMALAAERGGARPREISFTGTLQTLLAFAAVGTGPATADPEVRLAVILRAVATHRVGDRPDRVEPRAVKRRPKKQTYLTVPREQARARLLARS